MIPDTCINPCTQLTTEAYFWFYIVSEKSVVYAVNDIHILIILIEKLDLPNQPNLFPVKIHFFFCDVIAF